MKKTHNINISGYGFVIDEDAYEMLDSYLSTLDEVCRRAGETETAADIEQRMAEIFTETLAETGRTIITLRDTEEVIGRIGRPEEIVDTEEIIAEQEVPPCQPAQPTPPPPPAAATPKVPKRLFRDLSNKVLGGVCSGLGWYLGIDPVWIRVIVAVLTLLTGSTVAWIYIILWIVVPAAKTPYQRMQMMGMNPSVSNVGKVVTGEYCAEPENCSSSSGIAKGITTLFLIIGLLIVGSLLLAFSVGVAGCIVALCVMHDVNGFSDLVHERLILGCVTGGMLVVAVPLFFAFRSLLGAISGTPQSPLPAALKTILIILWVLGLAAVITCGRLL